MIILIIIIIIKKDPWVGSAIFWIEGVLTPIISLGGIAGDDDDDCDDDDDFVHVNDDDYFFEDGEFTFCNDSGNVICILILSKRNSPLDLKPSFSNLLICLVS